MSKKCKPSDSTNTNGLADHLFLNSYNTPIRKEENGVTRSVVIKVMGRSIRVFLSYEVQPKHTSEGLAIIAARFARRKGWSKVYVIHGRFHGNLVQDEYAFVPRDFIRNVLVPNYEEADTMFFPYVRQSSLERIRLDAEYNTSADIRKTFSLAVKPKPNGEGRVHHEEEQRACCEDIMQAVADAQGKLTYGELTERFNGKYPGLFPYIVARMAEMRFFKVSEKPTEETLNWVTLAVTPLGMNYLNMTKKSKMQAGGMIPPVHQPTPQKVMQTRDVYIQLLKALAEGDSPIKVEDLDARLYASFGRQPELIAASIKKLIEYGYMTQFGDTYSITQASREFLLSEDAKKIMDEAQD
jgi:hypothetical protein